MSLSTEINIRVFRGSEAMRTDRPFLSGIRIEADRIPSSQVFPFSLPFVPGLNLEFDRWVTFFVGENGTGKSTLLEAIAALCRLPVSGGGRNELGSSHGPEDDSTLSKALRPSFRIRPYEGFFLRAELAANFASLLDDRRADPDFQADPYSRYGGRSLHTVSHGEAFLAVLEHRLEEGGIYLLDEPESALSPQRQLALLALIHRLASNCRAQFIVATHSPILLTYPGAQIISFDTGTLRNVELADTAHYTITRNILENPNRYWRHFLSEQDDE